jgi:hypothetical protein
MGLVVVTLPLVAPLPLNVPAGCHVASRCATLLFAPAGCCVTSSPPPPLNALTRCHLASHRATFLFIPAGCRVTPSRDTASQRVGWLYVASHCTTLMFDLAGCCITPCRHHRHPLRSCRHLAVHVTADENARAPEPAAQPVYPGHSRKEPHNFPLEGYVRPSKSGLPQDINPRPQPAQCVECPGKRHRVIRQRDDVVPDDEVVWRAGIVGLDAPPQHVARDNRILQ